MDFLCKIETIENHNWWFTERKKLVLDIINGLKLKDNAKVLDLGCGTGNILQSLKGKYFVVGLDELYESAVFNNKRELRVIEGQATDLPFKGEDFDLILLLDTLEHIKYDQRVMSEVKRVLRKDGHCLITVPAFESLWGKEDDLSHHVRRYNKKGLMKIIQGFDVKRLFYWNSTLFVPVLIIRKVLPYKRQSQQKNLYNVVCTFEKNPPKIINKLLKYILNSENFLIKKGFRFPFGISLFTLIKK